MLATFFQRAQVLIWSRFKAIMEAHIASISAAAPKARLPGTSLSMSWLDGHEHVA